MDQIMPWIRNLTFGCLNALTASLLAVTGSAVSAEPYQENWYSLARHDQAPEWFRDAKFGIYFHWGVYSVPALDSEWYPRHMHFEGHPVYKHHLKTYGHPSEFGYHDFVPMFKAEHFDADAWAELFAQAGAKFAGPVAEHHDGFAMWDSEVTPWNVADMGPQRDITGELEKAIRAQGMKFIATFHHAFAWDYFDLSYAYDGADPRYADFLDPTQVRRIAADYRGSARSEHASVLLAILMLEVWLASFIPRALRPSPKPARSIRLAAS